MKMTRNYFILFIYGIFIFFCPMAVAAEPMDALQNPVENVLAILKDPELSTPEAKTLQQEKISVVTQDIFDYTEMSKRALAQNWKLFTPAQRQSFAEAFGRLLENTYTNKVQGGYKDEKVSFLSQEKLTETVARVKTKITGQSIDIPVDYSMYLTNGRWRIYDVNIEGVSLVMNYRNQFKNILAKESPDQLIDRVRNKLTE